MLDINYLLLNKVGITDELYYLRKQLNHQQTKKARYIE